MNKARFAEVAPAVPLPATGRQVYSYEIPPSLSAKIKRYQRVRIPFGPRHVSGTVIALTAKPGSNFTKPIVTVEDTMLTTQQVALAEWIARTMHGGLGYTLRLFYPPTAKTKATARPVNQAAKIPIPALKKIIAPVLKQKQQVLVLVPEKWLAERWQASGTIIYADLPPRQLAQRWQAVAAGGARLIIGTHKALFLPFKKLGLVVLLEEQFNAHKNWDQYPRLHNRLAAQQLAALHQAHIVYHGSAPSVWLQNAMAHSQIRAVVTSQSAPPSTVLTLSWEERRKRFMLPASALSNLRRWLKTGEQVLVLYNRRQSLHVLEAYANHPGLRVGTVALLAELAAKSVDRVLWLFPELTLRYPDFRSRERARELQARLQQLLPTKRSLVIITREPQLIKQQLLVSSTEFFDRELKERRRLHYPPEADMVQLTVTATDQAKALKKALKLREELAAAMRVLGPYRGFKTSPREASLLLLGTLSELVPLYETNKLVDRADVEPERII